MKSYLQELLNERFADRELLPAEEAKRRFWADLPPHMVEEFFAFFELEYGISAGILRPTDEMTRLTEPVKTANPLRWFVVEPTLEDKASELSYELAKRVSRFGTTTERPVRTVGDYLRIWCGLYPLQGGA